MRRACGQASVLGTLELTGPSNQPSNAGSKFVYTCARIEGAGDFSANCQQRGKRVMRSIRFWTNTVTALALLSSASLCAQEAAVPSQQATPAAPQVPAPNAQGAAQPAAVGQEQSKTVLFEGTPVRLRLTREVSSANAQVGDAVNFDVVEDVRLGNVAVIPKGSHALAKITTVVPKRRMGRAGKLDMSVEYVRLPSGEKLRLSGAPEKSGNGHQGRMAGAMVVTGIIVWPAAPFFLFMHGKDITIPAGQEVAVYTAEDYDLPKARAGDTSPVAPAAAPATTNPAAPAPSSTVPVSAPAPANTDSVPPAHQ
jgi:hypothetical protein